MRVTKVCKNTFLHKRILYFSVNFCHWLLIRSMIDPTTLARFIFQLKGNYAQVSGDEKEKMYFILNRRFARGYPLEAELLNQKGADKAAALDWWFDFFRHERYTPNWFYPKTKPKKIKPSGFLGKSSSLTEKDIFILEKLFPDEWAGYCARLTEKVEPDFVLKKVAKRKR